MLGDAVGSDTAYAFTDGGIGVVISWRPEQAIDRLSPHAVERALEGIFKPILNIFFETMLFRWHAFRLPCAGMQLVEQLSKTPTKETRQSSR